MQFRTVDEAELARIYRARMVRDFPADELKPLSVLLSCLRAGSCRCYALYDGAALAAYAVVLLGRPGAAGILDYLAVAPEFRDRGVGGGMLRRLREALSDCAGLLIEYEAPGDAVSEDERATRLRREGFYLRNGVRATGMDLILFGVHFRVGYLPCVRDVPDPELKQMQIAVYDRVRCRDYRFLDELK